MIHVNTEADLRAALLDGGDITVDTALDLATPLEITQPGTRVHGGRYRATDAPAWLILAGDAELRGAHLAGNLDTDPGVMHAQRLVHAIGTQGEPLDSVRIVDCVARDTRGDAVRLEWCRDSRVTGLDAARIHYAGVMILSGDHVRVEDCTIADVRNPGEGTDCYGIAVTDIVNTDAARSRDCAVIGNSIRVCDWEGIDTHGGDGLTIVGNTITGSPRGIALVSGNASRITVPTRITVTGNSISTRGMRRPEREGIYLGGIPNNPATATIVANTVTGYTTPMRWADYIGRGDTVVGLNNRPMFDWTPLDQTDADFGPNATYPIQYCVDGDVVWLRGGAVRKAGRTGTLLGRVNAHARPGQLTWVSFVRGTNPAADEGTITVYPTGELRLNYPTGTDGYTVPGSGAWRTA